MKTTYSRECKSHHSNDSMSVVSSETVLTIHIITLKRLPSVPSSLMVRIVHVMCRPLTNVHMSITSTLLSIENLSVMCGRVASPTAPCTNGVREGGRERERERAGEVSHQRVPD